MNTLKPTAAKLTGHQPPLIPSLNLHRPFLSKSLSSLSFRFPPPRSSLSSSIRASLQNNPNSEIPNKTLKIFNSQIADKTPYSIPFLPLLKTTLATAVAAAALVFSGFYIPRKPCIASPIPPQPTSETAEKDSIFLDSEREQLIEEQLLLNPDDVEGLKNLMEIKIKSRKLPEAIEIIEKLVNLEPDEIEWPMMRAHLHAHHGDFESAKNGFNELLKKNPFRVEAYHGLVTVASQEESSEELKDIEKRVEEAIKLCKKDNKNSDARDFKLLLAQIKVLESQYDKALRVYQELVNEEPRDFRPYLCQGIIYTLLKKNNEAEKSFEKYRRLVPKGHPYASYFDDNMLATKLFAQKVENERAVSKT
ncbi:hypothetical protein CASFOL_013335 [Castilleja foliolosa]|uniref:Chloroplast lumen common family protein n=1 Tax=Castilleja foliolosa TaxID=1961234 RepID=A0ABD3DNS1_9LAMI